MDSSMGGVTGGSSDQHDKQSSQQGKNPAYHRHNPNLIARLEEIFSEIPHPDNAQRRQIAEELGLGPKQVKFWFQNKRTQRKLLCPMKIHIERANNNALRAENESIHSENERMKGLLRTVMCKACRGSPLRGEEENGNALRQLQLENIYLKAEHLRVSRIVVDLVEQQGASSNPQVVTELTHAIGSSNLNRQTSLEFGMGIGSTSRAVLTQNVVQNNATRRRAEMAKQMMSKTAMMAKNELLKLICTNEPLWVSSPMDHRYVLHAECYARLFPRSTLIEDSRARDESSKDSIIVKMNAMGLINRLLDSEKWANLFPTIVTKASTIQVVDSGSVENRSGALLLMHAKMHVLSPLVPSREFYFLRSCHKVEGDKWVIADVSVDYEKENPHCCWRFPSGCMIYELSSGSSLVSWVEHVEVEDNIKTHRLYRDLVNDNIAYGAERWLMELQRMSRRITSVAAQHMPTHDAGVVVSLEGRRNVLSFTDQIVKIFRGTLNMTTKMDFPQHLNEEDDSATRISVCKNTVTGLGLLEGMIVISAATSFWLPLPSHLLFDFFKDPTNRHKWDGLCGGNPMHEIAHISINETYPRNHASIIRAMDATKSNVAIIQECFIDPLGAYVVYSSCSMSDFLRIMNGDSSEVAILPSGIVISEDAGSIVYARMFDCGNGERKRGSQLTLSFQILMSDAFTVNLESVSVVNSLMNSIVRNMKDALMNYYHLG